MLQIPSTMEDDLLSYFLDKSASWVRQELQHHGAKFVDEAIIVAKSLIQFEENVEIEAITIKPTKGNFSKNIEDARKAMQWGKPNCRQNNKVDYRFGGNTRASWKNEYDEKKRGYFTTCSCFVCK